MTLQFLLFEIGLYFGKPNYVSENRKMFKMYLDRILGSKTKVNALAVLLEQSNRSIIEIELAREAGMSVSEVNRQIKDLVNSGLVVMERVGKTKMYHINSQHFLFNPLKSVFRDLREVYREVSSKIIEFIKKRYRIKTAILFGSLSKGTIRSDIVDEPSDIDIIIITENREEVKDVKKSLLEFISSNIVSSYGIVVYPMVLATDEYRSRLSQDKFIIDAHARGEVLYGEKPRRFS